ncbi:MAG TPA: UrcA family protein [Rhizomicrobium sp.]|nr:UrcA family protein [Rhizomicrobium sp.]
MIRLTVVVRAFAVLTAAALLVTLPLGAAQAGSAVVRHGDLDLSSPAGLQTLKVRVLQAAKAACGPAQLPDFGVSARTLYEAQADHKACVRQTAARGLERILGQNRAL